MTDRQTLSVPTVPRLMLCNNVESFKRLAFQAVRDCKSVFVAAAESKSAKACNITPKFSGVMAASVLNARKAVICLVMFVVFIS